MDDRRREPWYCVRKIGNANIRPMSMLTTAAMTNDERGGGTVRAITTQADPDGWREWKNTFRQALFGVADQGEIAKTATESTTQSDEDIIDDGDMVCFYCEHEKRPDDGMPVLRRAMW